MSRIEIDEKLHEDLVSYIDGELDDEARARIEEILKDSDEARAIVAELEQLGDVLKELTVNEPPLELDFKVETTARRALKRPNRHLQIIVASGALAAAACAVLVLSVSFLRNAEEPLFGEPSDSTLHGGQDVSDLGILVDNSRSLAAEVSIDGQDGERFWETKSGPSVLDMELDPGAYHVDLVTRTIDQEGRDNTSPLPRDRWNGESNDQGRTFNAPSRGEPSMVIRTVRMRLIVDDLEGAVRRAEDIVARRDGHIQRSSVERHHAIIVARVPSDGLDELRQTLRGLGEIIVDQTRAQDVTGEVMDIESRLRNARVTEERLLALAAERSSNVEQILAVERELMRVREEIERLDGQRSSLRDQVSLSTITIELDERLPDPERPSAGERLGEAAGDGVENVGELLVGLGELAAAYGLSFLLIALLAYVSIRLWLRWWRKRAQAGSVR